MTRCAFLASMTRLWTWCTGLEGHLEQRFSLDRNSSEISRRVVQNTAWTRTHNGYAVTQTIRGISFFGIHCWRIQNQAHFLRWTPETKWFTLCTLRQHSEQILSPAWFLHADIENAGTSFVRKDIENFRGALQMWARDRGYFHLRILCFAIAQQDGALLGAAHELGRSGCRLVLHANRPKHNVSVFFLKSESVHRLAHSANVPPERAAVGAAAGALRTRLALQPHDVVHWIAVWVLNGGGVDGSCRLAAVPVAQLPIVQPRHLRTQERTNVSIWNGKFHSKLLVTHSQRTCGQLSSIVHPMRRICDELLRNLTFGGTMSAIDTKNKVFYWLQKE